MTPAEHARLIDKQEFEAECQAARRHALRYSKHRRQREQQRIRRWIETPVVEIIHAGHNAEQRARIEKRTGVKAKRSADQKVKASVGRRPHLHTLNGVTKTLDQWAEVAGCEPHTLQMRLFSGIPLATAVTMKPRERTRTKAYTVNGVCKTLRQWAEHTGIAYDTLFARLRRGYTLAEAITMPAYAHRAKAQGVSPNFWPSKGTGAGSTAQETSNITFEEKAE